MVHQPHTYPKYKLSLWLPLWLHDGGRVLRVYEGVWGNLFKEPRSSISFFYPCHRVLANLTPGPLVSVRSLSTRPFGIAMLLAY
jgi:hypothetical protein